MKVCVDIEASSQSEGEGWLKGAICSQFIQNDHECGYAEIQHEKCNQNYHHCCLMHVQERSFRDKIGMMCMSG